MPLHIDDRWMWLGVGILAVVGLKGIRYAMTDIVRLTEIEPQQPPPKAEEGRQPEDSLDLETLRVLATSPNLNIANSAISIIVQRFANDAHAMGLLLDDLKRPTDSMPYRHASDTISFLRRWADDQRDPVILPAQLEGLGSPLPSPGFSPEMALQDVPDGVNLTEAQGLDAALSVPDDPTEQVSELQSLLEATPGDDPARLWRNRHSMVLHEGSGRLRPEDIIRP